MKLAIEAQHSWPWQSRPSYSGIPAHLQTNFSFQFSSDQLYYQSSPPYLAEPRLQPRNTPIDMSMDPILPELPWRNFSLRDSKFPGRDRTMREWKLSCDAWSRVKIDTRWRCWTSWSRLEDGWELAEKNILRIVILWLLKLWDYSKASIWLIIPRSISSDIGPSWMSRSWKLFPFEPRMIVNEEAFSS